MSKVEWIIWALFWIVALVLIWFAKRKPPRRPRLELKFTTYSEADRLIRTGKWGLAQEEDRNHVFGMVYIERYE
jgi:hypothetical protein